MSVNGILDSSESDEDCQKVIRSTKKSKRGFDSSENETEGGHSKNSPKTPNDEVGPGTTRRSSERLKEKSQRRYSMPDRRQTLNKIVVKKASYENWSLKPRRLTSDFVKGLSHYVTDRANVFESDDSELSDFIDDSYVSTRKKRRQAKPRKKRKDGKCSVKTDETEDIKEKKTIDRKRKRRKKVNQLSSDDEIQSEQQDEVKTKLDQDRDDTSSGEDSDINKSIQRSNKHHKNFVSDVDKSSSSEDDDSEKMKLKKSKKHSNMKKMQDLSDSDKGLEPMCKLPKRTRSAKKEKEGKLLAKLKAKRNMEKLKMELQKTSADSAQVQSTDVLDREIRLIEDTLKSSQSESEVTQNDHDRLTRSEGESDQEFVISDHYCDADSDGVTEFFKHLHNIDNTTENDSLELKEKKSNNFQRICIPEDSDESDAEASAVLDSTTLSIINSIKENNFEYVRSLLESKPTVINDLGPKRRSLLHYAVISGSSEITKLLINCNADLFALDLYSLQPINYAILTGHINCLKLLLECTDLNETNRKCKDNFKFNLLHFIVYGKLHLPASLKCKVVGDSELVQCIHTLFMQDRNLLSELMGEKDCQGFNPLVAAIITGNCQCVEHLLYQGALADDYQSKNGGNVLHLAVECSVEAEIDRSSCLRLLLCTELKQKIDEVDNSGFTPLMCAAQSGNHDCVLALLEAGALLSCKDLHGTTSLHLAAASGDTQCVELLLKYGHQVDCLDSCGWPPLLYANFVAQESCVLSLMKPNPKQIFILGNLLKRDTSQAAKERNFKVVKDVLVALANQDAYYRVFNDFIRCNPEILDQHDRGLLHKTWKALLDYDNKLSWFQRKLANLRSGCQYRRVVRLDVHREDVFESTRKILKGFSGKSLRDCALEVSFKNEPGICTGPKREFFINICRDIVDSGHKLFHLTDDNQYSFIPNAYFAEMAKTGGGTLKDENITSSKMETDQLSGMGNDGLSSTTMDVAPSNASSGISVNTPADTSQSSGSQSTLVGMSGSSNDVAVISRSPTEDSTDGINSNNSTLLDTNVLPSTRVDSFELSGTHSSLRGQSISGATNSSVKYVDGEEDQIIAEIDSQMEYAKYVDQKLAKNIAQLKFLGRIIGLAICEGLFLNLHLCKPLVKQILGIKLNHPDDLSSFDHALHKNLVTFVLESDDVEDLLLPTDLDVLNPWNRCLTAIKLFPEDRNEEFVNERNKVEYVELVSQHKLTDFIKAEMNALTQGLYEVIPKSLFSLFTADEFSLLINGVGKIDVDDWRKNTLYTPEDAADRHKEINWFWQIVKELKEEEKALLLKFSTGSPCLPAGGFSQLQGLGGQTMFNITMKSDLNKIPTASTCFNNLKLSTHENIKDLKEKLLIAIRHGTEGFSFS